MKMSNAIGAFIMRLIWFIDDAAEIEELMKKFARAIHEYNRIFAYAYYSIHLPRLFIGNEKLSEYNIKERLNRDKT